MPVKRKIQVSSEKGENIRCFIKCLKKIFRCNFYREGYEFFVKIFNIWLRNVTL